MKETLGKEFYESADKTVTISRPETFNLERATLDAANDIIENGYISYFNTGVRFGFYDPKEEDEVLETIISNLKQIGREDILQILKEKI
jgi:hypothetical protein